MKLIDLVVMVFLFLILGGVLYITRPKRKKDDCGNCSSDCASCPAFSKFFEDYKKDKEDASKKKL